MITFSEVVKRYNDKKGKVLEAFLADDEARQVLKAITPTSRKYIKVKKGEAEEEHGRKLNPEEYRVFRDCVLAEVCSIELNDPNIRQAHGMEPAV